MAAAQIRTLYTDLDGTLLGVGGCLLRTSIGGFTLAGARALELCHLYGAEVTPVSGRSLTLLREDARLIGAGSYIGESGCVVVRDGGRRVEDNCAPFGRLKGVTVYDEIAATGAPQLLLERFGPALEYHAPWHTDHRYSHLLRGFVDTEAAYRLLAENGFETLRLVDNGIIEDRGYGMPIPELHAYHLIPRTAGKGAAIAIDQALAGTSAAECIACGDSVQDLEMAPYVRTLYLVGNVRDGNPDLEAAISGHPNVVIVSGRMVEGFLEVVETEFAGG